MLTISFNNGCDGVSAATARLQLPPTALDHNVLFLLWSLSHGWQCVNVVENNEEKSRVMTRGWFMLEKSFDGCTIDRTTTSITTNCSEHRLQKLQVALSLQQYFYCGQRPLASVSPNGS